MVDVSRGIGSRVSVEGRPGISSPPRSSPSRSERGLYGKPPGWLGYLFGWSHVPTTSPVIELKNIPVEANQAIIRRLKDEMTIDFAGQANDLGSKLLESFHKYGFAIIRNHNINQELIDSAYAAAEDFFASDIKAKMQYHHAEQEGEFGYCPMKRETAQGHKHPDHKEFFQIRTRSPKDLYSAFDHRNQQMQQLHQAFSTLSDSLIKQLAGAIADRFKDESIKTKLENAGLGGDHNLRLIHYPGINDDDFERMKQEHLDHPPYRAAPHTDLNFLTLLPASKGDGLQILHDNKWVPVNADPGTIIVNAADGLDLMTRGYLSSTWHRVVVPDDRRLRSQARYSMPFFSSAKREAKLVRVISTERSSQLGLSDRFKDHKGQDRDPTGAEFLRNRLGEIGFSS